ncbi:MAG TPA: flagellar basal-body rod protein FlgG [Burkholderiaceae bacterium]
MNHALYIAATGMHAQQLNVDTIANNLANLSTSGFKATQVAFRDLMYRDGAASLDQSMASAFGTGVTGTATAADFRPGELKPTGSPYDIAIRGDGFFAVTLPDGSLAYTRGGTFKVGADGQLTTAAGHTLARAVHLPADATEMQIAASGAVTVRTGAAAPREVGQLELVSFTNPAGLKPLGDGLYGATALSGDSLPGKPGQDGLGSIAHMQVEGSNVKMSDEMVNLMLAQRAYQLNAKMIETADEFMAMTNNLRRS